MIIGAAMMKRGEALNHTGLAAGIQDEDAQVIAGNSKLETRNFFALLLRRK